MAKVLIIGSGGREHALGWKLIQSQQVSSLYFAPGNGGTARLGTNIEVAVDNIRALADFAEREQIDLTVVGPEVPLEAGIVDLFEERSLKIFGPRRQAALLETSKAWTADFLEKYNIPHPVSRTFRESKEAKEYIQSVSFDVVVKASGLAAGKGVIVPETKDEAIVAVDQIMNEQSFGDAGNEVVVQEKIFGQEVSLLALSDGETIVPLLPAQDHKRIFDHDEGPNTGGMGAYAPTSFASDADILTIQETILRPTIEGMKEQGTPYKGVLYAGLMMTESGPKVIEFNARFGDPECQPIMMLLDVDLYDVLTACISGSLTPEMIQFKEGSAVCLVLAAAGYPGAYKKGDSILGLETITNPEIQVFHAGTIKTEDGAVITAGGRVLGVTAWGEDLSEALELAYGSVGAGGVYFADMQFRTDIGKKGL
ncbi:MAG: phosphoribosylamine--glycine ligase [Patescibacteria group bacterium]